MAGETRHSSSICVKKSILSAVEQPGLLCTDAFAMNRRARLHKADAWHGVDASCVFATWADGGADGRACLEQTFALYRWCEDTGVEHGWGGISSV